MHSSGVLFGRAHFKHVKGERHPFLLTSLRHRRSDRVATDEVVERLAHGEVVRLYDREATSINVICAQGQGLGGRLFLGVIVPGEKKLCKRQAKHLLVLIVDLLEVVLGSVKSLQAGQVYILSWSGHMLGKHGLKSSNAINN